MENGKLDSMIQETLNQYTSEISMSSDLQKQIKQEVRRKSEEKFMMRRISKRRVILVAAALCMVGSMAAVAAGKVTGWVSHTNPNRPDFVSIKELEKAEAVMGCSIHAVDKFENGYQFTKGYITDVQEMDDQGNVVGKFPEIKMKYDNGSQMVMMSIYPVGKVTSTEKHKEIVNIPYGETLLTYTKDIYKFVPPNYEVTPEEEALMEAGELYISYGSEKVEIMEITSVSWKTPELGYLLMPTGDSGISQTELVEMAEELIDLQQ